MGEVVVGWESALKGRLPGGVVVVVVSAVSVIVGLRLSLQKGLEERVIYQVPRMLVVVGGNGGECSWLEWWWWWYFWGAWIMMGFGIWRFEGTWEGGGSI